MSRRYPILWHWGDALGPLADLLAAGGILGFPTESSYAIGADPCNPRGVAAVFAAKRRPATKPLPVVLGDLGQIRHLGGDPNQPLLLRLARLWPAPLTVVIPIERALPATMGRLSLAVRIPAHEKLVSLLRRLDCPLTATSANLSGREPVSDPEMLNDLFDGRPSAIVDDGRLAGGRPSTLVRLGSDSLTLVRQGAYPLQRIERSVGVPVFSATAAEISADDSVEAR